VEEFTDRFYQSWGRVNAAYHDYARRCGLNDADIWVYYLLYSSQEGCAQSDICRIAALPKQTVNSAVVRARKAGHLDESPNPADARSKTLTLTTGGRAFAEPIITRLRAAEHAATCVFTDQQLNQSLDVFDEFSAQIERLLGEKEA
jgi:DNA-binding MarR family transcriptional regulator